jgi:predicted transcriptional regulator
VRRDVTRMTLAMTDEATKTLYDLAQRENIDKSEVLRKALGLFVLAVEAKAHGLRTAFIDAEDRIVNEVANV